MKYHIETYRTELSKDWNDFIKRSANGTFLHQRNYMDYHAERFNDASLLVYNEAKIMCVLPAHRIDNQLFSHNGLTYGDFIFHKKIKLQHKVRIVQLVLKYLYEQQVELFHIKTVPWFFHSQIDESINYILFQSNAVLQKVKPFFVVLKQNNSKPNRNRERNIKRIDQSEYEFVDDFQYLPEFWSIINDNLQIRYKSYPVHNLAEMQLLIKRFPKQIKFYGIRKKGEMLAGAICFLIRKTLHFQYLHAVSQKNDRTAVEVLTYNIVKKHKDNDFISFGSSEVDNNLINKDLAYWKESFGSQIINQYFYTIAPKDYSLLEKILQ